MNRRHANVARRERGGGPAGEAGRERDRATVQCREISSVLHPRRDSFVRSNVRAGVSE